MEQSNPATLAEVKRNHILHVLEQAEGNVSKAARLLGIKRATIYYNLKKWRKVVQAHEER